MIFIETPAFTDDILRLMPDDLYAKLQEHLADHPDAGDLIEGTGGVRKVRWRLPGTGKSGGVRVITTGARRKVRFSCCWSTRKPSRMI